MRAALALAPVRAPRTTNHAAPSRRSRVGASRGVARAALDCGEIACAVDEGAPAKVVINGKDVRASALRAVEVVNADGARVSIGSTFGDASGKNVLVVLRHLG